MFGHLPRGGMYKVGSSEWDGHLVVWGCYCPWVNQELFSLFKIGKVDEGTSGYGRTKLSITALWGYLLLSYIIWTVSVVR